MHGFRVPRPGRRGARRQLLPIEGADEKSTRLADLLRRPRDRVIYEYDFGDGWEHEIVLEDMVEWVGEDFDPARFDVQAVNRALHGGRGPAKPDA